MLYSLKIVKKKIFPLKYQSNHLDQQTSATSKEKIKMNKIKKEIYEITVKILKSIESQSTILILNIDGDYETYKSYCDESLTCFEPEAGSNLIVGLDFHKFYFTSKKDKLICSNTTISSPNYRILNNVVIFSYTRLIQRFTNNIHETIISEETRVYENKNKIWYLVHFHRSQNS